jgi:hypothetical protein
MNSYKQHAAKSEGVRLNFLASGGRVLIIIATTLLVLSCSGGGAGTAAAPLDNGIAPSPVSADGKLGVFIDSPVKGLSYETGTRSGLTGDGGTYIYDTDGEPISFTLSGHYIGSGRAQPTLHVFDLGGGSPDENTTYSARIAQLLQTLDDDGNPSNGIVINESTRSKLNSVLKIDYWASQANWDAQMAQLALTTGKNVVALSQAVQHATQNQPASDSCVLEARNYPFFDVHGLGSFSTKDASCDSRAKSAAFFEHVATTMWAEARGYRDSVYISDGETIAQSDRKRLADSNWANNTVTLVTDILSTEIKGESAGKAVVGVLGASAKLTKDAVETIKSIVCASQANCVVSEDLAVKYLNGWLSTIAGIGECFSTTKGEKCIAAVEKNPYILSNISEMLKETKLPFTDENVKGFARWLGAAYGAVAQASNAATSGDRSKIIAASGRVVDTVIKTGTDFYTRSAEETATRGNWANAFEILGEGINTWASCAGALKGGIDPIAVVQSGAKCASEFSKYVNNRSAEIFTYGALIFTVYDLNNRADDLEVAHAFLSEIYRYGGLNPLLVQYKLTQADTPHETRDRMRQVLPMIAGRINKSSARDRYVSGALLGDYSDVDIIIQKIFLYRNLVNSNAQAIQEGRFTTCRNVELSGLNTPDLVVGAGANNRKVEMGKSISFSVVSGQSTQILGYEFDFGDGNREVVAEPNASHAYTALGGHLVTVTPVIKGLGGKPRHCEGAKQTMSFMVADLAPSVISVSPTLTTIGAPTSFTFTGQFLPLTAVPSISDATCGTPATQTATTIVVSCTISGAAGLKAATVKTNTLANGGTQIGVPLEITANPSMSQLGLLAHYPLDSSGVNLQNGLVLAPTNVNYAVSGNRGLSAQFGGRPTNLIGASPITTDTSLTVSTWARVNNGGIRFSGGASNAILYSRVVDVGAPCSSESFGLSVYGGKWAVSLTTINGGICRNEFVIATNGPSADSWYHYVVTFDKATRAVVMYVDGVAIHTFTAWGGQLFVPLGPIQLMLGDKTTSLADQSLNGSLDDLRIYSRALTATEVQSLFNLK